VLIPRLCNSILTAPSSSRHVSLNMPPSCDLSPAHRLLSQASQTLHDTNDVSYCLSMSVEHATPGNVYTVPDLQWSDTWSMPVGLSCMLVLLSSSGCSLSANRIASLYCNY